MSSIVFFRRIFTSKEYWLSVLATVVLLMSSIVYKVTGEEYTFWTLFYDDTAQHALKTGVISINKIILGYDSGYLWMFCPIIVGIPFVILNRTERFLLFRMGKNRYVFAKSFSSIIAGGLTIVIAYLIYAILGTILTTIFSHENIWNLLLLKKMLSVLMWGVFNSISCMVLSEFIRNKYLILCIPFVLNYVVNMFMSSILPYSITKYTNPYHYQSLFLLEKETWLPCLGILIALITVCFVLKKTVFERRCDCGQQ